MKGSIVCPVPPSPPPVERLGDAMAGDGAFQNAVTLLLEREGGLVDHPVDPGGITKYGISLRFLKGVNPKATAQDICVLTVDEAIRLYRQHFWQSCRLAELPEDLATKMLLACVNMGAHAATLCLQRAIRTVACQALVHEDGRMGPHTISAALKLPQDFLLVALRAELAGHYRLLVARNPALSAFLPGWLSRAYS